MKTIWKFSLQFGTIEMPKGAKILAVQNQNDAPCMWAEVDDTQPLERRVFTVFGTGHDLSIPKNKEYIGTYQQHDGVLIWHLYEILEAEKGVE